MRARADGKPYRRNGLVDNDALDIRTVAARRVAATVAQCATVMQRALQSGPMSETELKDAVRAAGFTTSPNVFAGALAWLRTHRQLESKTRRPRGRIYTLPTARGIDPEG